MKPNLKQLERRVTPQQVYKSFFRRFGQKPEVMSRAPGRVVLLGAHVDYSEGWVLPAAIDRSVYVAAAPVVDGRVSIYASEFDQLLEFDLQAIEQTADDEVSWLRYPMGLAWSLRESGRAPAGMNVVLASDLPMGAGVSSSAALEMSFLLAWEAISGFQLAPLERAQIGQKTENEYLRVGSGIMDQFVSLHGARDRMVLIDCRSMEHELLPVPPETSVIVVESGVRRRLAAIDYNARPRECRQAVEILKRYLPEIRTLRDVSRRDLLRHAHRLSPVLRRRAEHVIGEIERVLAGAEALRQGDAGAFGRLIRDSQVSSRDNYENSIPELDLLAETAWRIPGCYGARFAGGGFGGVMQVFCRTEAISDLKGAMSESFERETGRRPPMFTSTISDGAGYIEI